MKWKKQNQNNSDAIFYVISRYKAKLSCEKLHSKNGMTSDVYSVLLILYQLYSVYYTRDFILLRPSPENQTGFKGSSMNITLHDCPVSVTILDILHI